MFEGEKIVLKFSMSMLVSFMLVVYVFLSLVLKYMSLTIIQIINKYISNNKI